MISKKIKALLPAIRHYLHDQPVIRAWLFGSFSRGEENDESDVDVLVDYDHSEGCISLFTMGGILMDLSDIIGRRVDLVDNSTLKNYARESVDRDKILIYERS